MTRLTNPVNLHIFAEKRLIMVFPEHSNLSFSSPKGVQFVASIVEHKGGVNDYGWWIVEAEGTGEIFDVYIGKDVNDSQLVSGGRILERFDKDVYTEEEVKKRVQELNEKEE